MSIANRRFKIDYLDLNLVGNIIPLYSGEKVKRDRKYASQQRVGYTRVWALASSRCSLRHGRRPLHLMKLK